MAKKKAEGSQEVEATGVEEPKKAYEGGEVVYWLQGEVSKDDSPLIRNAKRVFNEQTIPHVENDATAVANIKYAMMTGAPAAPQREEVNPAGGAASGEGVPGATEAGGRFIPPVATPTAQGNEGERANTPERAPSGQTGKPETQGGAQVPPPQ